MPFSPSWMGTQDITRLKWSRKTWKRLTSSHRGGPFGLKNTRVAYQRTTTTLLHDMMHKEVEIYVDNMIFKYKDREGHHAVLENFFMRLQKYNMRLNPQICAFRVTSGKFLGHFISFRGIEIDPTKIKSYNHHAST